MATTRSFATGAEHDKVSFCRDLVVQQLALQLEVETMPTLSLPPGFSRRSLHYAWHCHCQWGVESRTHQLALPSTTPMRVWKLVSMFFSLVSDSHSTTISLQAPPPPNRCCDSVYKFNERHDIE